MGILAPSSAGFRFSTFVEVTVKMGPYPRNFGFFFMSLWLIVFWDFRPPFSSHGNSSGDQPRPWARPLMPLVTAQGIVLFLVWCTGPLASILAADRYIPLRELPGWATYRRDPDQTALWPSFIELLPRTFCFLLGLAITDAFGFAHFVILLR